MTVKINEIVALAHRLRVNFNNSDDALWSLRINDKESVVHMSREAFLSTFIDFEIEVSEEEISFPYRLVKSIEEVSFFSLMDAAQIVKLRNTMPDQWEYIQLKLQEEEKCVG